MKPPEGPETGFRQAAPVTTGSAAEATGGSGPRQAGSTSPRTSPKRPSGKPTAQAALATRGVPRGAPVTDGAEARQSGLTLWRQIVETLHQEIGGTDYPPGARLPTEAELAARFGVNRHTVRRALEELSRGGLIRVEQGRGTFVAEDVLDYTVGPRTRFTEWIHRHNKEPSGRILQRREIAADATIAAALAVRPGSRVVVLERLGLADDMPVSLARHYFPATRLRGILAALTTHARITDALKAVGVEDYVRQVTKVTARAATPGEVALLRMARNRPVLITESINVDRSGTVVEFSTGCYPTPRVQIVFEPGEGPA